MRGAAQALLLVVLCTFVPVTRAQDIEPRSYSNAPIGTNFLIAGYAYTRGGLSFDSSLPISDAQLSMSSGVFAYARSIELWGRSAKFDVAVPYSSLSGTADFAGQTLRRDVAGLGDPRARVSVNFYGAPPLTASEFRSYRQDLIIGGTLQVSLPLGQYDSSRLINLGSHRWFFKPEIGASKSVGQWTLELAAATTFYTDNANFYGGSVRRQDPLYSVQTHVIYSFMSGAWGSLDATWFSGGRTSTNGILDNNLQQNWRIGATFALPVDVRNSVKFYVSSGVSARTGNNFDLAGIAWQYRWGGGL